MSNNRSPIENTYDKLTLEFIKHLYLFRARGQLSRLQDCISAEQNPDGTVYLAHGQLIEVIALRRQVFFQLAVEAVVDVSHTGELLRQHPDLLEPLNQVLYGAARHWERGAQSFTANDLFDSPSVRMEETRIDFKAQIDELVALLTGEKKLPQLDGPDGPLKNLCSSLGNVAPLIEEDLTHADPRYFWRCWIDSDPTRLAVLDSPAVVKFRSDREWRIAAENIRCLSELMNRIGYLTPFDLCRPFDVLDYCPPDGVSWEDMFRQLARGPDRELAELHAATLRDANRVRDFLLLLILDIPPRAPTTALFYAQRLVELYPRSEWSLMAEEILSRWDSLEARGDTSPDLLRSYDRLVRAEARDIAEWSAEGLVLLDRLRRLSSLR